MSIYPTDEEIITLYTEGNPEAFKLLVLKYTPSLYNFVARIGDRNNAPDIVQETFIKIWKKLHKFDATKASLKTWIFTIARNTTTDSLRKKKMPVFSDIENTADGEMNSFEDTIPDERILPLEALEKMEDVEFLNTTLAQLPADDREILVLHYQEEMTFDEIGTVRNEPLNTVKSKHRRALLKLRGILS